MALLESIYDAKYNTELQNPKLCDTRNNLHYIASVEHQKDISHVMEEPIAWIAIYLYLLATRHCEAAIAPPKGKLKSDTDPIMISIYNGYSDIIIHVTQYSQSYNLSISSIQSNLVIWTLEYYGHL